MNASGETYVRLRVAATAVIPLRQRVLRPGLPVKEACFPGDNLRSTWHVGTYLAKNGRPLGAPVCCATFVFNQYGEKLAWQLRGMATDPKYQGKGLGKSLLLWAEEQIRRRTGMWFFWCNARTTAVEFYEKQGWKCDSGVFDIEGAGPHRKMIKCP